MIADEAPGKAGKDVEEEACHAQVNQSMNRPHS
jgi:hypothetical protein